MRCPICCLKILLTRRLCRYMHVVHEWCFESLIRSGSRACPTCREPYSLPLSSVLRLKDVIRFNTNTGWQPKKCFSSNCSEPEGRLHYTGYCQTVCNNLTNKAEELMTYSQGGLRFLKLMMSLTQYALTIKVSDLTQYKKVIHTTW